MSGGDAEMEFPAGGSLEDPKLLLNAVIGLSAYA